MFTVFTPVFNRRDTIHRVYDSLIQQTYKNFEWIVIDDGSTDNVIELLNDYRDKAPFPVTVLQQKNMGKHVAWNRAVKMAKGELFVPADSDDAFIPSTLETFRKYWLSIEKEQRYLFSGINVLCKDGDSGLIVGDPFPESSMISNNLDLAYKHKIKGEKWGCIRTDVLKERPFAEIPGSYLSEAWIWFYIARRYNVLCVNEPLRYYYSNTDNSVSKPSPYLLKNNAEPRFVYMSWHLNQNIDYILKYDNKINIIKNFINYWRHGLLAKKNIKTHLLYLTDPRAKAIGVMTMLPGVFLYHLTYRKYNNMS